MVRDLVNDQSRLTAELARMPDTTKKTGIRSGSRNVITAFQKSGDDRAVRREVERLGHVQQQPPAPRWWP